MRDALNSKEEELNPILIAQRKDEYYAKSGLEFIAWTNLQTAREQLELANGQKEEAGAILPEL